MADQQISRSGRDARLDPGFAAERLRVLLSDARRAGAAPKAFTGCVSEISSCEQLDHDYTDALKTYAALYQKTQAYLAPGEVVNHDYVACAQGEQDTQGAQVAAQLERLQMVELTAPVVSDDEVEGCGYLGWLRH